MKSNFADTPMMRFVRKTYREQVERMEINGELKASLLRTNKLAETFIKNVSAEFEKVQAFQKARNHRPIKTSTLRHALIDFLKIFIKGIENQAEKRQESDIAKYEREHAGDHQKDMENTLAGKPSGVYEDLGVEIARDEVISLEPSGAVVE